MPMKKASKKAKENEENGEGNGRSAVEKRSEAPAKPQKQALQAGTGIEKSTSRGGGAHGPSGGSSRTFLVQYGPGAACPR